jgi:hypothetical protein
MRVKEFFSEIHVINLPGRVDRRQEVEEQLVRQGSGLGTPRVHLFSAVRPTEPGPFPTIGARGCFLSHLGVLEAARQRQLESVLILEDDCNLSSDCIARLHALGTTEFAGQWELFYGGTLSEDACQPSGTGWAALAPELALMGAHFIAVRGPAISGIADYFKAMLARPSGDPAGGPMHVDGAYSWYRREHPAALSVLASPAIAYQRSSRTDVHGTRRFDALPGARHGVAAARRLKNTWSRLTR